MVDNSKIGAALIGGYLLGRTKKAKLAITLGMLLAGKKLSLDPKQLGSMVADSPLLSGVTDQMRRELFDATKSAATTALTKRIGGFADSLHDRTAILDGREARGDEGDRYDDEDRDDDRGSRYDDEDDRYDDRDERDEEESAPARKATSAARPAARKTASSARKTGSSARTSASDGRKTARKTTSSARRTASGARKTASGTARRATSKGGGNG